MFLCFALQNPDKIIWKIKTIRYLYGFCIALCNIHRFRGFLFSFSVEDLYESVNDREIRQVFEGQNRIHLEIKQLHRQLAMILDEQRRYVSVITDEIAKKGTNAESGQVGVSLPKSFYFTQDAQRDSVYNFINDFVSFRSALFTQTKMDGFK